MGSRRIGAASALGWAIFASATTVGAQVRTGGWSHETYEPSGAGDITFAAERPTYRRLAPTFGLVGSYSYLPLVLRQGGVVTPIVEHAFVTNFQAGISFLERFQIHVSMPVAWTQTGPIAAQGIDVTALNAVSAGDPRLTGRVRIVGDIENDPFSLHVGGSMYFGFFYGLTGRVTNNTDGEFRGRVWLNAGGIVGKIFEYSVQLGYHGRPEVQNEGTVVGSSLYSSVALGVVLGNRFRIGTEFFASTILARAFEYKHTNAELLGTLHYTLFDSLTVGLAAGGGLTQGAGTPTFRGLFQVTYTPAQRRVPTASSPRDTDHDGVLDELDACVTIPQGEHPDPARRGCPLEDRDHDGVLDPNDQCVDVPQGEHPDPARLGCPDGDDDNDSVRNSVDVCPTVAQGEHPDPGKLGCPAPDRDGDLVLDADDVCVDVPAGERPDPSRRGCPLSDRDLDTVTDDVDHCPEQPGIPTSNPQTNGCPNRAMVVDHGVLRLFRPVFFATNSDRILPKSFRTLEGVAQVFRDATSLEHISVDGHTDDVGDDAANLDLSRRRAESVRTWLIQHGIAESRLVANGYGETRPLTAIDGLRGRPLSRARGANRRVEFRLGATNQATER